MSQPVRFQPLATALLFLLTTGLACSRATPNASPDSHPLAEKIDELVERYEKLGRFSGTVAVAVDGELLFARGYGHAERREPVVNSPTTRFDLAQHKKLFAPHSELRSDSHYGYGWFLSRANGRSVAHHGGAGDGVLSEMHRFADERLSIIVLANYAPELGINAPAAIVDQVAALFFGLPRELPPAVAELSWRELAPLAGRYSMTGGDAFDVVARDGQLWAEVAGKDRSVFDLGMLEDLSVFDRGAESALGALQAGLADDFSGIPLCDPLRQDLAPGELRDEWLETAFACRFARPTADVPRR